MNEQQQQIYREAMQQSLFKAENEKTRFDKIIGKDDMIRLREIFSKPILNIEEINEIQSIIIGSEIKLTNLTEQERYINHKFYLWISWVSSRYSKAIRADEQYQDQFKIRRTEIIGVDESELADDFVITLDAKQEKQLRSLTNVILVRQEIQKDYAVIYKEAVNTYLFGLRSPLSAGGNLIKTLATERKELSYEGNLSPVPQQQQIKGGQ